MRRAKTLWLCLLPLLFFAAGGVTASAAGERDVALISFDPMSDRLSATVMCTLDVVYDGTLVTAGLRGYHLEVSFDDTYVYVDSLDIHITEGSFLSEKSTREAARGGEWYISNFGMHEGFESWDAAGRPELLDQTHEMVEEMLANHQPLPFDETVERELQKIQESARTA